MKIMSILVSGTIFVFFLAASAGAGECIYAEKAAKENAYPAAHGICGTFVGPDDFRIFPQHLAKLLFKNGLAELLVDGKAFYIAKSGKAVRVPVFENGADYFSEGLARTIVGGKLGFIDKNLTVVIKPEYDFAFPFAEGRAMVCIGCVPMVTGEYEAITGGKWGVVDKTGKIILPVRYSRKELEAVQQGKQ